MVLYDATRHDIEVQVDPQDDSGDFVRRGDLVLLCVHSVPPADDPNLRTDPGAFTLLDGVSEEPFHKGQLLVGVMGARYAPDHIHGVEHSWRDAGPLW